MENELPPPFYDSIEEYLIAGEYQMDWKRFWSNPYKWGLWHWIGGRPWTYIIRDARQKYPTPWMLGVMVVSALIGHFLWSWGLLIAFGILLVGILWGHLWWGTKIILNQEGK